MRQKRKRRKKIFLILLCALPICGLFAIVGWKPFQITEECGEPLFELSPIPDGLDFAFSIIDDTDYSTGPDVAPVYEVLKENGMRITRAIWMRPQTRPNEYSEILAERTELESMGASMADPEYRKLAEALHRDGFEIALHGVSGGNDTREEIIAGYEEFRNVFGSYPKIDILHSRNIENLYAGRHKLDSPLIRSLERLVHGSDYQGHIPGSKYFWGDVSVEHVKYVRLPFHALKELNLLKISPTMPFHDPSRPYVNYWFPNSDGSYYADFMAITAPSNVNRLKKDRGVTIIYSHFAYGFTTLEEDTYKVRPEFRDRIEEIASNNGYFAPASDILDWLLAMRSVSACSANGYHRISNRGSDTLEGVTLLAAAGDILFLENGSAVAANGDGEIILPSLGPHSSMMLLDSAGPHIGASSAISENIPNRFERLRIELSNYFWALSDRS